jgi:hypothetical protein
VGDRFVLDLSPLRKGAKEVLKLSIQPPTGFALEDAAGFQAKGTISRFAEGVRVVVPLRPAIEVLVVVTEPDGRPAPGVRVFNLHVGGTRRSVRAGPTDREGQCRVRGVPEIWGELVRVEVVKNGRQAHSDKRRIERWGERIRLEARLPPAAPHLVGTLVGRWSGAYVYAGTASVSSIASVGYRLAHPPVMKTRLEVRVFRRTGAPAGRVLVRARVGKTSMSRRTDARGLATFVILPPGTATITVREPGFVSGPPVSVELLEAAVTRVEIREAVGGSIYVQVLDEEGLPVPFARITVKQPDGQPYTLLEDGRQILTHYTDRNGLATLPGLPPGPVTVTATFGTRKASAKAEAGATLELRLSR